MEAEIRKIVSFTETTLIEGRKRADPPLRMFAVAAVMTNPWAGAYVDDLQPVIRAIAPGLGQLLTDEMIRLAGSGDAIEAYGKAAVVGTNGEVEHASGLIHTLRFGNIYREAVGAESFLSFTNTRGGPDAPIAVPLQHKHDGGKRSHYLTLQFSICDAPAPDEVVVALGGAIGGRPHHRIGDRYQDMRELEMNHG